MPTLEQAMSTFITEPTEDNAQDINLEAMSESTLAFLRIPDGVTVSSQLLANLEEACRILSTTREPTDLTIHYADVTRRRLELLKAMMQGDSEKVKQLLAEALK